MDGHKQKWAEILEDVQQASGAVKVKMQVLGIKAWSERYFRVGVAMRFAGVVYMTS